MGRDRAEGQVRAADTAAGAAPSAFGQGVAMAVACYGLWGVAVIFYKGLAHVPAIEVIAHRGLWSVVFLGLFLWLWGRIGEVRVALADPAARRALALSSLILVSNWLVFVWAIAVGRTLEVSFGYFINPIFSVLIGALVLGERLTPMQRLAVLVSVGAVALQSHALAGLPWVSLYLAGSFAIYGLMKKRTNVRPTPSLFIESLVLLVPSLAFIGYLEAEGTGHFLGAGDAGWSAFLLMLTGPVTAIPLILFGAAVRRVTLIVVGLLQYIAPTLHFIIAISIFGEPLDGTRLAAFAMIWLALAGVSIEALLAERERRRAARSEREATA